MQLTMNSNEASVSKVNCLVSWLSNAAKKISAVFVTKKETPAVNKELTEAIRAIEWRTRYDQQRIVNHVRTLTALMQSQKLCTALGVKEPTYISQRFKNDRMNRFLLKSRTQELMLNEWGRDSYGIHTVNLTKTDNSFERKLVRWFGDLNPTTKLLLDGKSTRNQRWVKKNARITELYLNRLPMHNTSKSSLNRYEQQMLNALIASATTVPIATAPALLLPGAVIDSVQSEEIEAVVETVAEVLPIEETVVLNTTPLTDAELAKLRQAMARKTSINKLLLPDLKLYAKAHRIHIPGSAKRIRAIKEIVITAQRGSTKLIEI